MNPEWFIPDPATFLRVPNTGKSSGSGSDPNVLKHVKNVKKITYQYNQSKRRINQLSSFLKEHSTVFSVQLKQKIN